MGAEVTAMLTLPAEVNERWPVVLGWTGDEEQIGQRGIYTPHLFPTSDLVLCVCETGQGFHAHLLDKETSSKRSGDLFKNVIPVGS